MIVVHHISHKDVDVLDGVFGYMQSVPGYGDVWVVPEWLFNMRYDIVELGRLREELQVPPSAHGLLVAEVYHDT